MYWVSGQHSAVDTGELAGSARTAGAAANILDGSFDAALRARMLVSAASIGAGYSPSAHTLEDSVSSILTNLGDLAEKARSLSGWRATAAMIYASAEQNAQAMFAACEADLNAACGTQKLGLMVPAGAPGTTGLRTIFGAVSLLGGVRQMRGSGSAHGVDGLFIQEQVVRLSAAASPLTAALAWLLKAQKHPDPVGRVGALFGTIMGARNEKVVITTSPLAGFGAFKLGSKIGGEYAEASITGIIHHEKRGPIVASRVPPPVRIDQVLEQLDAPEEAGMIEVLKHENGDGKQDSWSVLIRGTKEWTAGGDNPQDMLTNMQEMAGIHSAQRTAVLTAMEMAGIQPGDPVELVGHSQGGIVATNLAADPAVAASYSIASVLTAGSPVALAARSRGGARSLHLENLGDLVPALDGKANAPARGRLTVHFSPAAAPSGVSAHAVGSYQKAGEDLENGAAKSPEVDEWLEHRRDKLKLNSQTRTESTKYWVRRSP